MSRKLGQTEIVYRVELSRFEFVFWPFARLQYAVLHYELSCLVESKKRRCSEVSQVRFMDLDLLNCVYSFLFFLKAFFLCCLFVDRRIRLLAISFCLRYFLVLRFMYEQLFYYRFGYRSFTADLFLFNFNLRSLKEYWHHLLGAFSSCRKVWAVRGQTVITWMPLKGTIKYALCGHHRENSATWFVCSPDFLLV